MRYCLTVDLKDNPELIASYEAYHKNVWPEILQSLSDSGIISMEIYRLMNRMFMILETTNDFSFEKKATMDAANPKVQE
jgi:L-rhamnose mutarotase